VTILKKDYKFFVFDKEKELAAVSDTVNINLDFELADYNHIKKKGRRASVELQAFNPELLALGNDKKSKIFKPPKFGLTVLGNSHGFDPKGSTSGYIIWVNGR
jgi:hypothetical protein